MTRQVNIILKIGLVVIALVSVILHSSCASSGPIQVMNNRSLLNSLEIGMSKAQVVDTMGEPRLREAFSDSDGEAVEVLLYQTEYVGMGISPKEQDLTPILLKGGKVIGWGRSFYEQKVRIKLEVEH